MTRQPESLFTTSGWGGDLCICHCVQPLSMVHPPSYGTGSGSSFSGFLPPSYGMVTGSSFSGDHPPSSGKGTGSSLSGVLAPTYGMGTGGSLSGVHPPYFGWALEALCLGFSPSFGMSTGSSLGSIHPPLDGHWRLSVWGSFTLLWNEHWKLSVWGPCTLLWMALEALYGRNEWDVKLITHVHLLPKVKKE